MACGVSSYKPPKPSYSNSSHHSSHCKPHCCDKYEKGDKELMKDLEKMQREIKDMMDLLKSRGTTGHSHSSCKGGCQGMGHSCKGGCK